MGSAWLLDLLSWDLFNMVPFLFLIQAIVNSWFNVFFSKRTLELKFSKISEVCIKCWVILLLLSVQEHGMFPFKSFLSSSAKLCNYFSYRFCKFLNVLLSFSFANVWYFFPPVFSYWWCRLCRNFPWIFFTS